MTFVWGTEVTRRERGIAFQMYAPRRTHLASLLDDAALWSDRTHLVQGSRRLTYADLFARIEATAALLHDRGVRPGDRLLLLAPNSPEWIVMQWAGIRLGAVVALGNGWWSEPEIAHAIDLISPTLVIADARRGSRLPAGTPALDIADLVDVLDRATADLPTVPDVDEDDPALILFTAGTTGAPKAVALAHRSVIANLHNLMVGTNRLPHQLDPTRAPLVILQSGPLFHVGGLQATMLNLLGGATVVFLEGRFDAGQVLELLERERVTVWGAVPTMATRLVEHPAVGKRDLSSVRSITMGGAPVPPALLARLRDVFPNARKGLSTIYGMTELGGTVASASGALMAEHPSTAGPPGRVVDLRIENPDSSGEGEIAVRTPSQMLGYWTPEGVSTANDLIDADGFVHTGDLGRLADGLLYVTGRLKDLIIRGGENIAPAHVEAALLTHPQVRNAAVLGRPDPDLGEIVGACVEADPGVTVEHLLAHVKPLLSSFSVPAEWWLRTDPLPMTDAGKTDKLTLAANWPSAGGPGAAGIAGSE
ncbi:class I adenylate-forming enzyme family protein [Sporichthya sp.]|uniref:class I adenylate-forming enzyme family protein n=1 Tax=Sporichthya sp. TaxID=65475 RepID=UPI0018431E97|nr:class I adenylate-forming enzyme family protein [Sporichthya sp.]MBA3742847.1 acyl--CoA ligase [Sporichthya sp.]